MPWRGFAELRSASILIPRNLFEDPRMPMITRRRFLTLTAALPVVALSTRPALAAQPEVFARDGVAINGYDAVAYFTDAAPVEGNAAHSVEWKGTQWRFANAENLASFEANPEAFAPQYGGYCAYAASKNAVAPTSPDAWTVYEGKLYLNFDTGVRDIWKQDIPGNIAKADANWPSILG